VDTCQRDFGTPSLLPKRALPADLRGSDETRVFAPQLNEAPIAPVMRSEGKGPTLLSSGPSKPTPSREASASAPGGSKSLFPLPATASSVVYVLDRSMSMGMDRKLDFARRELIASLRRLPNTLRFQVIDYNEYAEVLLHDSRLELFPAETAFIERAELALAKLEAGGDTNHGRAVRRALLLRPDVLYLLTDADNLRPEEVEQITHCNQGTAIHTIELTRRTQVTDDGPLARLARDNHGSFRRVAPVP
jgi:hypothetical protein